MIAFISSYDLFYNNSSFQNKIINKKLIESNIIINNNWKAEGMIIFRLENWTFHKMDILISNCKDIKM